MTAICHCSHVIIIENAQRIASTWLTFSQCNRIARRQKKRYLSIWVNVHFGCYTYYIECMECKCSIQKFNLNLEAAYIIRIQRRHAQVNRETGTKTTLYHSRTHTASLKIIKRSKSDRGVHIVDTNRFVFRIRWQRIFYQNIIRPTWTTQRDHESESLVLIQSRLLNVQWNPAIKYDR